MRRVRDELTLANFVQIKNKYGPGLIYEIRLNLEKTYTKTLKNKELGLDHQALNAQDNAIIDKIAVQTYERFWTLALKSITRESFEPQKKPFSTQTLAGTLAVGATTTVAAVTTVTRSERVMWQTEQDNRVCPICAALDGREWDVDDPDIPIPPDETHPNCRCALKPV